MDPIRENKLKARNVIFVYAMLCCGCKPVTSGVSSHDNVQKVTNTRDPSEEGLPRVFVTAETDRRDFTSGEAVTAYLTFTFDGSIIYIEGNNYFHGFSVEVTLPSGEVAKPSPSGSDFYLRHMGAMVQSIGVGPHYTDSFDFPLSELFDLSKPGEYRLRFARYLCHTPQYPDNPQTPKADFTGPVYAREIVIRVRA
jgi:hypothetical protein